MKTINALSAWHSFPSYILQEALSFHEKGIRDALGQGQTTDQVIKRYPQQRDLVNQIAEEMAAPTPEADPYAALSQPDPNADPNLQQQGRGRLQQQPPVGADAAEQAAGAEEQPQAAAPPVGGTGEQAIEEEDAAAAEQEAASLQQSASELWNALVQANQSIKQQVPIYNQLIEQRQHIKSLIQGQEAKNLSQDQRLQLADTLQKAVPMVQAIGADEQQDAAELTQVNAQLQQLFQLMNQSRAGRA